MVLSDDTKSSCDITEKLSKYLIWDDDDDSAKRISVVHGSKHVVRPNLDTKYVFLVKDNSSIVDGELTVECDDGKFVPSIKIVKRFYFTFLTLKI